MPILRLKITRLKDEKYWSLVDNPLHKKSQLSDTKVDDKLYEEALLYVFASIIFVLWAGLQWWHWYNGTSLSPIPLTLITLGLGVYCYCKITTYKEYVNGSGDAEI